MLTKCFYEKEFSTRPAKPTTRLSVLLSPLSTCLPVTLTWMKYGCFMQRCSSLSGFRYYADTLFTYRVTCSPVVTTETCSCRHNNV